MTQRKGRLNQILLIILIVVIAFIPKVLGSLREVNDPFIYPPLAATQASLDQDRIVIHPFDSKGGTLQWSANSASERAAGISIVAIISRVTELPLEIVLISPLNGVILFALGYALAKYFLRSKWLALAFAVFISYEPVTNSLANTVLSIGWGYTLFFTFVLLTLMTLEKREIGARGILLLFMIFVTTYLMYYTAEIYMIVLCIGVSSLLYMTRHGIFGIKFSGKYRNLTSLSMAFVVIFVAFDNIFYSYLRQVSFVDLTQFLTGYVDYVQTVLLGGSSTAISGTTVSQFTIYSGALVYVSLAIPILVYLGYLAVVLIRKTRHRKEVNVHLRLVIFLVLLAIGLVNVLVYAPLGVMGFKYILLFYPLLAFYSIKCFVFSPTKRLVIVALIVALCVMKSSAYYLDSNSGYADNYHSYMNPTAIWVSVHLDNGDILTDLKTGGNLLLEATQAGKTGQLQIHVFSNDSVAFLNSGNPTEANTMFERRGYDYLVVSYRYETQTVIGANWLGTNLGGDVIQRLDDHLPFHKVFDDGHGLTYKFVA